MHLSVWFLFAFLSLYSVEGILRDSKSSAEKYYAEGVKLNNEGKHLKAFKKLSLALKQLEGEDTTGAVLADIYSQKVDSMMHYGMDDFGREFPLQTIIAELKKCLTADNAHLKCRETLAEYLARDQSNMANMKEAIKHYKFLLENVHMKTRIYGKLQDLKLVAKLAALEEYYAAGIRAAQSKDFPIARRKYEKAMESLQMIISRNPPSQQMKDLRRKFQVAMEVLEADELNWVGEKAAKREEYNEAIKQYTYAIDKIASPWRCGEYYYNRAKAYFRLQKYEEALNDFDKSTSDPEIDAIEAWIFVVKCNLAIGDHDHLLRALALLRQLDVSMTNYKIRSEISEL